MNAYSLLQAGLLLQVFTSGRLWGLVAIAIGLTGVIIGRMALVRATRDISSARRMGGMALAGGLIGIILSLLNLARATGGVGTGNGVAGTAIALLLALIAVTLGWLALARSRRIAKRSN